MRHLTITSVADQKGTVRLAGQKGVQLRIYTKFDGGEYLGGWSESGLAGRIKKLLDQAGVAPCAAAQAERVG